MSDPGFKRITTLKRTVLCLLQIKVLTDNWYMTLAAALYSQLLKVSDKSNKVKRIEPYPEWLLSSPTSKRLLVWNLPEEQNDGTSQNLDNPTLSHQLLQKFNAYGHVQSFWMLPPGKDLPKELQCYAKRQKELGQCLCAVVKFDSLAVVRETYTALKAEEIQSSGKAMRVVSLGFRSSYFIRKDHPSVAKNQSEAGVLKQTEDQSSSTETGEAQPQTALTLNKAPACSTSLELSICGAGDCVKETDQIPWVLRRKLTAQVLTSNKHKQGLILKVLRQPYGPDGTGGFHSKRTATG